MCNTSNQLVINWHLTEACNYGCQYCYASWKKPSDRELIHDAGKVSELVMALYDFFKPGNTSNPLTRNMSWQSVRLNLAGGEPLLYASKLPSVARQARTLGMDVSIITNASRMTRDVVDELLPMLTWIGVSLDSSSLKTNQGIGRMTHHGEVINFDHLSNSLSAAQMKNPSLSLKINTVVNKLNYQEDFSQVLDKFSPKKWKVLRMLPVTNDSLAISEEEFFEFVERHSQWKEILCVEDNQDMQDSYLMVDPYGRFFQNGSSLNGFGYQYSKPIIEVGAASAFADVTFKPERYLSRYIVTDKGELV
jgi:radical S-adenosyl methionine domain-containing protein 2